MNRYLPKLLVCCLIANIGSAQVRTIKPVKTQPLNTKLEFGVGAAGSVLFLSRNIKENNEAYGLQASMVYGGSKLLRISLEYTGYQTIDIAPTWYNVKAQTFECNMHILARFNESRAIFYPLLGLSYNVFSGHFTGVNDYLNLSSMYPKNEDVVSRWWGVNAGLGFQCYYKRFSFYGDYKMRIGVYEGENLNIMDVCLSAGIRYYLKVPTFYHLVRGTRSRYSLKSDPTE